MIGLNFVECTYPNAAPSPGSIRARASCLLAGKECGSVSGPTCRAGVLHSTGDSAWDFLLRRKPENTCSCRQLVPQQQPDRHTDRGTRAPAFLPAERVGLGGPAWEWMQFVSKRNEWCFVVWLNGSVVPWMCYLGIFKEADGHIPEGFFSFPLN